MEEARRGKGKRRSKLCDVCAPAQATHSATITLESDGPERKSAAAGIAVPAVATRLPEPSDTGPKRVQ